jgi:hypothetical protein
VTRAGDELPGWLRASLYATGAMNLAVGAAVGSGADALLVRTGLPSPGSPFYTATVGLFILLFGVGYLAAAARGRDERLFLALSGAGKLSFVALVTGLWVAGRLPPRVPALALADLLFGALFLGWCLTSGEERSPRA